MALIKEIVLDNGTILNYHRIVSLNKIVNKSNIIEIASYISKEKRQEEKKYQEVQEKNIENKELTDYEKKLLNNGINVLIETKYISKNYDTKETIIDAYEYLKTLDDYSKSVDD